MTSGVQQPLYCWVVMKGDAAGLPEFGQQGVAASARVRLNLAGCWMPCASTTVIASLW